MSARESVKFRVEEDVLNAALNRVIEQRNAAISQLEGLSEYDGAVRALIVIANQLTVPKCTEGHRFNGRSCARHSKQGVALAALAEQVQRVAGLMKRREIVTSRIQTEIESGSERASAKP